MCVLYFFTKYFFFCRIDTFFFYFCCCKNIIFLLNLLPRRLSRSSWNTTLYFNNSSWSFFSLSTWIIKQRKNSLKRYKNKKRVVLQKVHFLFFSLTHVMIEKVLFWGQIFETEIFIYLQVMRFPTFVPYIDATWNFL